MLRISLGRVSRMIGIGLLIGISVCRTPDAQAQDADTASVTGAPGTRSGTWRRPSGNCKKNTIRNGGRLRPSHRHPAFPLLQSPHRPQRCPLRAAIRSFQPPGGSKAFPCHLE